MKLTLAVLIICCALGFSQSQIDLGLGMGIAAKSGFAGLSPGVFFGTKILEAEAGKLLKNPDLPDDLRQRVLDTMANAEQAFNNCTTIPTLPWLVLQCAALQLRKTINELKAIKDEATARAQAEGSGAAVA